MTYTAIAVVAALAAVALDRWAARTRLTTSGTWWAAYGIIFFFQLLTNGWLTGRGIVRYSSDAIVGSDRVIASTDCGFGTFAGYGKIDPAVAWAKLRNLRVGADIAAARG